VTSTCIDEIRLWSAGDGSTALVAGMARSRMGRR
jgi:hypothetical protein